MTPESINLLISLISPAAAIVAIYANGRKWRKQAIDDAQQRTQFQVETKANIDSVRAEIGVVRDLIIRQNTDATKLESRIDTLEKHAAKSDITMASIDASCKATHHRMDAYERAQKND